MEPYEEESSNESYDDPFCEKHGYYCPCCGCDLCFKEWLQSEREKDEQME